MLQKCTKRFNLTVLASSWCKRGEKCWEWHGIHLEARFEESLHTFALMKSYGKLKVFCKIICTFPL